jgi:hypothetical protein
MDLSATLRASAEHRAYHAAAAAAVALVETKARHYAEPSVFLQASSSPRHKIKAAIATNQSEDSKLTTEPKLRPVAATHTSQWSCPHDCPFMNAGCYSEVNHQRFVTARLNSSGYLPPEEIAQLEAIEIRGLAGYHPLRLHVVGDCKTPQAARIVAAAAMEYQRRHDAPVWTYTHAWRDVPREAWSGVSVLASCETIEDVQEAHAAGYAVERTVTTWSEAQPIECADGRTLKPFKCPQQIGTRPDCEACKFCFRDSAWQDTAYLALLGHGPTRKLAAAIAERKTNAYEAYLARRAAQAQPAS